MTIKQHLIDARELIANPKHWTQYTPARDKNNATRMATSLHACKWCATGAVTKVCADADDLFADTKVLRALHEALPGAGAPLLVGHDVANFNDNHSHAEVLAIFDKAIASCPHQ